MACFHDRPNPARAAFRPLAATIFCLFLPLAGCAGGDYPSLTRRAVEGVPVAGSPLCPDGGAAPCGAAPPAESSAPGASAQAEPLDARLADLVAQARAADADFAAKRAAVAGRIAAAAGAEPGGDRWAAAMADLSSLEASHAATTAPLADLDRLEVDDRVAHVAADSEGGAARPETGAIRAARAAIDSLADAQDAALARLRGTLHD